LLEALLTMRSKDTEFAAVLYWGIVTCFFVLLNQYWGIVMYGPGTSSWAIQGRHTHDPRSPTSRPYPVPPLITWGVRILTLHLNYVAGYTGPLLFLFERTYNDYVDNQGLVPWRLRRLGRSKVRSASSVKVLSDGKKNAQRISFWSQLLRSSLAAIGRDCCSLLCGL